eukprot:2634302-Amphidinium_carterae.1
MLHRFVQDTWLLCQGHPPPGEVTKAAAPYRQLLQSLCQSACGGGVTYDKHEGSLREGATLNQNCNKTKWSGTHNDEATYWSRKQLEATHKYCGDRFLETTLLCACACTQPSPLCQMVYESSVISRAQQVDPCGPSELPSLANQRIRLPATRLLTRSRLVLAKIALHSFNALLQQSLAIVNERLESCCKGRTVGISEWRRTYRRS